MRLRAIYLLLNLFLLPVIAQAQEPTETPNEADGGLPRSETGQFLYTAGADIFVINGDGSGLEALTSNEHSEQCPTWLADGNQIVFAGVISGQSLTRLYTMNADGSAITQLSTEGISGQRTYALHPSVDGSEMIWETRAVAGEERFRYAVSLETGETRAIDEIEARRLLSPNGLAIVPARDGTYVMDADGNETRILENGGLGQWSADGQQIAVMTADDEPNVSLFGLSIANSDGSDYRVVLEPNYLIDSFAWSPDGSHIGLIITNPNDAPEDFIFYLATVGTETGELTYLSEGASLPSALSWSADSARIAYHDSNVLGDELDWYLVDLASDEAYYFARNISECDTTAWRPG